MPERAALTDQYKKFRVVTVEKMAPNVKKISVEVPEGQLLGAMPMSSVCVKAEVNGKGVEKHYAPVSPWNSQIADFIIKQPGEAATQADSLDQHLFNLKTGDSIHLSGPHNLMSYKPNMYKRIGMIAESTGINPLMQVIQEALFDENDVTVVTVILYNETADDIFNRPELDALQKLYPSRFDVHHVLENPPAGWRMSHGQVDDAAIVEMMPTPDEAKVGDAVILVCGSDGMRNAVCGKEGEFGGLLKGLKYQAANVVSFPSA